MTIDNTTEFFHKNRINDTVGETNKNYTNQSINNYEASLVNTKNSQLQDYSTRLQKDINSSREKQAAIKNFDEELNQKLFHHFKLIIVELESTIELLKIINRDKPELNPTIKELINIYNIKFNNLENKELEMDNLFSCFFKGDKNESR